MDLTLFNQSKKKELSNEGECVRLSNELRFQTEETKIINGDTVLTRKARPWGFDIETATLSKIMSYLNDNSIKKSPSLISLCLRIISVRFKTEFNGNAKQDLIKYTSPKEQSLIRQKSKNNVNWFGEVGYFGKVRLDGSI